NGAAVNAGTTSIGTVGGSNGKATVDGAGSKLLNNAGPLVVGVNGKGVLIIQNGAKVSSGRDMNGFGGVIGDFSGMGTAMVTGAGSSWSSAGALVVGSSNGNGTLTIQNGAAVSSGNDANGIGAYIGSFSGTGAVTINSPGMTWNSTGALAVGSSNGNGTLTIQNGAAVSSGNDANGIGAY